MSFRPNYIYGQMPTQALQQHQHQQHTQQIQGPLPPWHQQTLHQLPQQSQQQGQPAVYTQPPHLAQSLLTYGSPALAKSENISPRMPSSTSKSPVPTKTVATPPTPTSQSVQQQRQKVDSEVFYLAIPKSEMTWPEVKSLLGETTPVKDKDPNKDELFIPPSANIKQEPSSNLEESVITENVEKALPPIDPSMVPEGEGMING